MKIMKKLAAVLAAGVVCVSLAGCHKANEIGLKIGNTEFTSAQYSYALLMADSQVRSKVDKAKAADTSSGSSDSSAASTSSETDYLSETVEGVSYTEWVETKALEMLRTYAKVADDCREKNITLTQEQKTQAKSYADYYYSHYEANLTANGIGKETYRTMTEYGYLQDVYFDTLYGKGGEREIPESDVQAAFREHYRVAYILQQDTSSLAEGEAATYLEKLNEYKNRLEAGESAAVISAENENKEASEVGEEISVLSVLADPDFDSNYACEFWDQVKDLSAGTVTILDDSEKGGYIRLVKIYDSSADEKYLEQTDTAIRYALKHEDFENDLAQQAAQLEVTKFKSALKPFTVKKIKYASTSSAS